MAGSGEVIRDSVPYWRLPMRRGRTVLSHTRQQLERSAALRTIAHQRKDINVPNIGPAELGIVLIIGLVIFGPKRLPEFGRSVGSGIRGFKESLTAAGEDAGVTSSVKSLPIGSRRTGTADNTRRLANESRRCARPSFYPTAGRAR
jgi:TatA/E family protein of Tat protein translocase